MLKTTQIIKTKTFKLAIYAKGSIKANKLALVLPGKLDSKDYAHMHSHVDFLVTKGYYALTFDPPGTWESEDDLDLYTMSNYYQAVNEVIEYYRNKSTLIIGHSMGGSIAILTGIKNKYVTSFIAIMSPITFRSRHYPDNNWLRKGYKLSLRDTPEGYVEEKVEFKVPYSFLEDQIQYDMTEDLAKCKKPKLFIAGSEDKLVSTDIVKSIYDLSVEPKCFHIIKSMHGYRKDEKKIQEVNIIISKFLDSNKLKNKKINIEQVIAVVLSFVNLYFPFVSFFIFVEYLDVLQNGTLGHFQFHTVWSDIVFMAFGVAVLISSVTTIFKYFRHKKVKLIYPVLFFLFPIVLYFIIPYSLYLLKKMN